MSSTPNRRSHEDGGNGSGSGTHSHPSGLKYPHDDQGAYSGTGGKAVMPTRHEYHAPYDMGQDGRIPKIVPRNESRDSDRKPPLLPNMFRVSNSNDTQFDHVGSETRTKVDTRDIKPDSRDLKQSTKIDSSGGVDDGKDAKLERDFSSDHKGEIKLDKTVYTGSNSSLSWKEQYRVKQNPDGPGGNVDTWHTSRTSLQGPTEAVKEGLHLEERDLADAREGPRENKFDMNVDDKFKDKDRKRKEMKHKDWGERDKDKHDCRNLQVGGTGGENKEVLREERESEKKDPLRDKEKLTEKIPLKRESWNESKKDAFHSEKELVDNHGKSVEQDFPASELKKKDSDTWKNVEGEGRDKKRERDTEVESERSDKHSRYHEKETEECGMESEGGSEVQQRKRMVRSRGSPPMGNRDLCIRPHSNDTEGPQGETDASCVVYKIGECMQELIKLWKKYELSQANKALQSSRDGPTLEIRIPAEHVTATNRQVRGGQLWGTDIYTVDSDLVGVLMHTGYCRPTASPPPPATQELCATIRVLPPQDCYISTLRNNVRSRAWGAAIGCSYCVERCCIVKKGGGIIDLEPCLTHSSTMEPTLAPVSVERTMTTRAAASNALRQQRFVREVTIQFNLCMEPWLKYSISAVADKGLKKPFFTSARMKKGEVLYVETHSCRYELCFNGEKVPKAAAVPPHASGAENGRSQAYTNSNGERNGMDGDSNLVDIYRWSRCKKPLTEKTMRSIGIPLPRENIQVLEEELEWENISWSQTGVWIAGKEYHLARVHFLSRN